MKQISQAIIGKMPERFSQKKVPKLPMIIVALLAGVVGTYVIINSFALTGSILWRGDYETGDLSQWSTPSSAYNTVQRVAPDRITVVQDPKHEGNYAARFEVRPEDTIGSTNPNARAEVAHDLGEKEGDERYYRWYTYFTPDFPTNYPNSFITFTQWRDKQETGAHSSFMVWGDQIELRRGGTRWATKITLGQWHKFVYHVKWSPDSSVGFIELWYDDQLVLPKINTQTMAGTPGAAIGNYVKEGLYKSAEIPTGVLYHDGFVTGTSYDAVADGGTPPSDTTAPTVSLTSPSDGATVSSSSVSLTADATDNVGVSKVEFYVDGNLVDTDTSSPYTASWDTTGATAGSHTITAKAYDAAGNIGASSATVSLKASAADVLFDGQHISDYTNQSPPGSITEVPDPVGSGQTVFKMTVKESDGSYFQDGSIRAQLASPWDINSGDERWWHSKFYLPADYPSSLPSGAWINFLEGPYGPPFGGAPPWRIGMDKGTNVHWLRNNTYNWDIPWSVPLSQVRERWVDVLVHTRFATDGWVEMWIDGKQVTFFDPNATGEQNPNNIAPTTRLYMQTLDSSNNGGSNADIIQNYRGKGWIDSITLYHWPMKLGKTRASVEYTGTATPPSDTTAPTVSMTAPSNGTTVSGSNVTVSADASDNVGVTGVQFKLDGNNLGSEDTSSPYSATWDTTKVADGTHILTAVARDAAGNTKTSGSVTVTVNNTPQASCSGSTDLVCEDFSGNANNFTISAGTWAVNNGKYEIVTPQDNPNTIGLHNRAIHSTDVNSDFVLKVDGSVAGTSSAYNDFGVVFDYQDSNNYYFASFNETNTNTANGIFRVVNGVQTQLADITTGITADTTYSVKIERIGSTINTYLNGNLMATTTDSTFNGGKVGLASRDDSAAFDNLDVISTAPAPDTTAPTVSFASPSDGDTVSDIVTATANATDNVGVTYVDFSLDGTKALTDLASPYNYSFDSTKLANGNHTLSATAYDAAGNTKTASITVNVSNPDTTAPSAPANLSAIAQDATTVNLSWNASTDSGTNATGVAGYNVLRNGVVIAQTTKTSYTDSGLTASTSYSYVVQAYDGAGNASANSNTATVTTPTVPDTTAPSAPTNLNADVISATQINLNWAASTDTGGSGLAGYNIYRDGTKLNSSLITTTSYGDGTLLPETTYSYTVEAVDGAGNKSELSLAVSATTQAPDTSGGTSAVVEVMVVDSRNQPVGNAQVTLNGQTNKTGRKDGTVLFYNVPVGNDSLDIKSKGSTTSQTITVTGDSTQTTPETFQISI